MKKLLSIIVLGYNMIAVAAATGAVDSTASHVKNTLPDSLPAAIDLQELVVEGKSIIQKTNSETYLPTPFQKRISQTGVELLNSLSVRGIYVNPVEMKIQKINGGAVQLRINNIRSDIQNVAALRPDKILRVEYYDSPSAAYGGEDAEAVINYVTVHAESGGSLYADMSNAVTAGLSNNAINTAFNTKSSEFSLNYFMGYRNYSKCREDGNDSFYYPDGRVYERTQQGINQPYSYMQHVISASWHLQSQNNYVLNVLFKNEILPNHSDNRVWNEHNNLNNTVLFTERKSSNPYSRPVLDIYYQKKITEGQEIVFDVVGTWWDEKNESHFSQSKNEEKITDYRTFVKGKKRSVIFEGVYSGQWGENSKLSVGVQHLQAYSDNVYSGSTEAKTGLSQANSYLFGEFSSVISKLGFSVGAGLNRSLFSENTGKYKYCNFRPSLSLKYTINDNHTVTNRFRVLNRNPALAQLSDVERFADDVQTVKGNPDLKPYSCYTNALIYNFSKKTVGFSTELNYQYRKNPVMENYSYDSDRLIRTPANQKNWNQLQVESQIAVGTLWNILRFSIGGGILSQHSNGYEYTHRLVSGYGFANMGAFYKNFSFSGSFKTKTKELFGETFSRYAPDISMQLQYIIKNRWLIGISTWNPFFSSLKNQFETKSKQTGQMKTVTFGDNGNVFSVRLAYILSFGRDYNTSGKKLNNSDTESGIMK
ncbi:MAG: outer membrane beta-barrel family protein [Dysgonamonadaceae bacterium]|jgi:hypothetical protein|nr:outer membrane beta-barrel family protein [Dysgonamonadaceae bacterium]